MESGERGSEESPARAGRAHGGRARARGEAPCTRRAAARRRRAGPHHARALERAPLGAAHTSEAPALGRGLSSGLSWRERSEAGEALGDGASGGSSYTALLGLAARLERVELLRRRWRLFVRVAGCVSQWHARARERAYAPGGLGFHEVRTDFEERARKAQRCAEG